MNKADKYMYELLNEIIENGYMDENPRPVWSDGTPAHTLSIDHVVRQYDIGAGEFPICTLRPIAIKSAIKEIMWIYSDQSNDLNMLQDKYNIHYWDEWESKDLPGTIGKRYGHVVRKYDLMNKLLDGLKKDPYGRRHIVDLYQYEELEGSDGLYPCAFLTIWKVSKRKDGKECLNLSLIQRSGDSIAASAAGVNETQYTALLMMVARHCGYEVGMFTHYINNEQLYVKHTEQAKEMIRRYEEKQEIEKRDGEMPHPKLVLNPNKTNFYDFTIDDFSIVNYTPMQPQLRFEIAI